MSVSHAYTLSLHHSFQIIHISIQKSRNLGFHPLYDTKKSQANWHLIHHYHITKLFYLLNQNTMFIIDNKTLISKLCIVSITKNLSMHHSSYSLFQTIQKLSHNINSSPLISNHIILKQNTIKGNKLRQHYSLVNTVFYVFSPQTPSLVVQSTVRSFPQVTPLFHKIILLDLPHSYKTKEYLTWSLSTTHNITPTVKKILSSAQAQTEN